MQFKDLSSNNLIGLSSSIAIALSKDLNAEETALLAAFLTTIADNLALIAIQKEKEEPKDSSN